MSKIKILEIVRDAEGGMKKHVKNLLDLDKNKFDIVLACSRGQFDRSDLKGTILNLYEISVGDRQSPWALIKSLVVLVRIIKKEKIDIIHAHGMACAITGTIAGIFSVKPAIITTVHNFPAIQGTGIKQRLSNLLSGFFLRFNRRVVAVSRNLGDFISSIWNIQWDRIRVIYNGIDVEEIHRSVEKCSAAFCEFHDPGIAPVTILNIARLIPAKGVDVFLRAAAIVMEKAYNEGTSDKKCKKNLPAASCSPLFLVAGDGPQMHELKNLACILGIEKNVRFLGFRTDIYDLIHLADMVVLSSRSEGLGISILEALALKKPVIASRVGGIPEIIIHGKTGLLVPPDDPEALAGAMIHLIQNPEEGKKMAFEGYKNLTGKYSKKFMLKEIENLYLDVYQSLH
ncbi:MAG TPA: glycosyltransferase family 4 protein [Thermoanaerobacterales bacterium]|nr:glycosyltransferase family 4 protein [Thermoanaerobacterales bacterium]